uniref:Pex2_Pex12 domain-containing protein n=1 Tax=Globodera pallida TaxID=36090 RepID=A0A183CHI6_GLOPA
MEEKLLIPEMMDKEVHKTECRSEFSAVVQCLRVEGSLLGPQKCKPYLKVYEDCKLMKFQDDDFRKKVTEDYIEERSKFREMGLKHWDDHLKGKGHQQNTELRTKTSQLMNRSVYLNNFARPIESSELAGAMDQFGEKRTPLKTYSVLLSVCALGSVMFAFIRDVLTLKERGLITMSLNISVNDRAEFAQQLRHFLQPYFASPLQIRVFGSSSTGLGFVNSDLDLNLVFDEDLSESSCGFEDSPSVSSTTSGEMMVEVDKQLSPETLKQSPMSRDTFIRLNKIDCVRLLNRLVNAFRKEKGLITAHVPIPDARTPVVRFMIRHLSTRIPCELSVHNLLGECKANLIRDLVRAETTGTLLRLIFFLKLWASCNGLFSPIVPSAENKKAPEGEEGAAAVSKQRSKAHPKANWNSYALSLLVVAFLQQKGRIPPIQLLLRHNSRNIGGWPIEYDLSFFALDEGFPTLLKGLFTFLYQQIKENRVISPRDGRVFEKDEFRLRYVAEDKRIEKKWRFSLVNVQDPLELSHNVAANVGKAHLASLRWKMMYAIAMLKRSPDDLHFLFRLDDPEQLKEQRRAEKAQNQAIKWFQSTKTLPPSTEPIPARDSLSGSMKPGIRSFLNLLLHILNRRLEFVDNHFEELYLVVWPYIYNKMEKLCEKLQFEQDAIRHKGWRRLFLRFYPRLKALLLFPSLLFQLAFAFSMSSVPSPLLVLAKCRLEKLTPDDMTRFDAEGQLPFHLRKTNIFARLWRSLLSFPSVLGRFVSYALFLVQFLEYYYSDELGRRFGQLVGGRQKIRIPEHPYNSLPTEQQTLCMEVDKCPICRRTRKNDTVLIVSGYVFCHACIYNFVRLEGRCPVTSIPATSNELVKIYH